MIFSLAIRNNLLHDFSEGAEFAAKNGLSVFLGRNLHLCLRKPQTKSLVRVEGFISKNFSTFFYVFESEMEK
jgi:hypothetical protein